MKLDDIQIQERELGRIAYEEMERDEQRMALIEQRIKRFESQHPTPQAPTKHRDDLIRDIERIANDRRFNAQQKK